MNSKPSPWEAPAVVAPPAASLGKELGAEEAGAVEYAEQVESKREGQGKVRSVRSMIRSATDAEEVTVDANPMVLAAESVTGLVVAVAVAGVAHIVELAAVHTTMSQTKLQKTYSMKFPSPSTCHLHEQVFFSAESTLEHWLRSQNQGIPTDAKVLRQLPNRGRH